MTSIDESIADHGDARETTVPAVRPARKAWTPELDEEVAGLLRLLAVKPWQVADRDESTIAAVRRNADRLREVYGRLGWVLIVDRDLARLRKSPPPRRDAWAAAGPNPLTCSWFFLLVAAAESMPPRVGLSQLVTAARVAAAEAGVATSGEIDERRAVVAALRLLDERGLVIRLDGDVNEFVADEGAPILLAVHHTRLGHVIANAGTGDPSIDPAAWLAGVEREPDIPRRMRRRLIDDAVVYGCDLDDAEADWLSRRIRGDDGGPLAAAFGLAVERRAEGAAFVVPDDAYRYPYELGPKAFPVSGGTVPHAALLVCDTAAVKGALHDDPSLPVPGPGPGWRAMTYAGVLNCLRGWAARIGTGRGGWASELVENLDALARQVSELLTARDLLRIARPPAEELDGVGNPVSEEAAVWWFSPTTGRWPPPPAQPAPPKPRSTAAQEEPGAARSMTPRTWTSEYQHQLPPS
jgi:uncharacterized protein (TIGR02678 family)